MAPRRRVRHRSPSPDPEIAVDMDRHVCLRFHRASEENRYQFLRPKRIHNAHHLAWEPLISLGVHAWFEARIPHQWNRTLSVPCIQYRQLILEFYTTYDVATGVTSVETPTISFRMRGEQYNLSLADFATRLGFYTVEELPDRIGRRTPMTDLERAQYWHQLTGMDLYDATTYKASNIRDPRIRILHRIIATAFYGRHESVGNVTHGDLEIMYALISGQFLCPARMLSDELLKMSGKYANQAISGGAFITLLAQGLGVRLDDLEEVGRNIGLTLQTLKHVGVIGIDRYRHFLLAKSGREWVEGGPGDGEDFCIDDLNFVQTPEAYRDVFGPRPSEGPSHTPLATQHPSPPRPEFSSHDTHGAGTSHSSGSYYPPQSWYDDISARMGRMELNQTDQWDYAHRQAESNDQRWGRLETQQTEQWDYAHQQALIQQQHWQESQSQYTELRDYSHQQAAIQNQRWEQTQQHFSQQTDYWERSREQWDRQD